MTRRRLRELKRKAKENYDLPPEIIHWQEGDDIHFMMPAIPYSEEEIAELTRIYQDNIRNSDVFEYWVEEFGLAKAEELVKQCHYKAPR